MCNRVDELIDGEIAICDAVRMEVFSGARDERHLQTLRRLLARASVISTEPIDYDAAATLYRVCRQNGETVRKLIDCLIGAVAVRADVPIVHADTYFDVLSRHSDLCIAGT